MPASTPHAAVTMGVQSGFRSGASANRSAFRPCAGSASTTASRPGRPGLASSGANAPIVWGTLPAGKRSKSARSRSRRNFGAFGASSKASQHRSSAHARHAASVP